MRRTLATLVVGAAVVFALSPVASAAGKLFAGWTGNSDVVSNGGSITLSQGGALFVDGGCIDMEDNFAAPTHATVICNSFIRLVDYGPPLARADIVTGRDDPSVTGSDHPAGSLYLRHLPDDTGQVWVKTGPNPTDWTDWVKVAGA